MNTDCVNCKHARLWTDKEQFEYIERMFNSIGRMPCRADHYICDKIPEGTEWTDDGKTYTYDGYSLDGENSGRWIKKKGMIYCSECGEGFDIFNLNDFIYCPSCGVKMGVGE